MWELVHKEGWVPKNWCFWIVVLEKTLESSLHLKEISPKGKSILKEIKPQYSLQGLMLKLTLQYLGQLMWRDDWLEKTLMLRKTEGKQQSMKWLDSITDSRDTNLSKLWEIVKDRGAWCVAIHGVTKSLTRLSHWTTAWPKISCCAFTCVLSRFSCVSLCATLWTLLPIEFSRQEIWNGLLNPPPGDLPNPAIKRSSPALAGNAMLLHWWASSLPLAPSWKPLNAFTFKPICAVPSSIIVQVIYRISCVSFLYPGCF